ncbi:hypothetical protein [Clostridium sp.]|jgi:hypothetical protein|uniref:hypothetical protein n=1 Tax=Clostridium sp. TaxID=1506 RepID=UPI003A16FB0D
MANIQACMIGWSVMGVVAIIKKWYKEVTKGKFHRFKGLNNKELKKAIVGMNQPKYNDVNITNKDIKSLLKKI